MDDLIAQGRLVRPVEESLVTDFGYYLLCRDNLQQDETINRLRNWLSQQFYGSKIA